MAELLPDDPIDRIRSAVTRLEDGVRRRPGLGRSTAVSTTTLVGGLRTVTSEGGHEMAADLGPGLGGDDTGPTPSALLRAALGSCLAMGYRLRAARHGIPVRSIRVEVETDSAIGGMLDPGSAFPPGCIELRYRVAIESPLPADVVEQLIDDADRLSPVLDTLSRAHRVARLPPSGPAAGTAARKPGPSTAGGDR